VHRVWSHFICLAGVDESGNSWINRFSGQENPDVVFLRRRRHGFCCRRKPAS